MGQENRDRRQENRGTMRQGTVRWGKKTGTGDRGIRGQGVGHSRQAEREQVRER